MARKRSKQLGGNSSAMEVTKVVQEETTRLKQQGKWKPVGSPLLHGLLGRSNADVAALAAKEWSKVTGGAGVVLVDGKPVDAKGGG